MRTDDPGWSGVSLSSGPGSGMAQPLSKTIDEIARSIKQGKVDSAVSRLKTVVDRIRDERELNRLGDLLARAGRVEESLQLYEKIGEGYAKNGILPKAVAIYKKILRLVPDHRHAKLQLGVLYLKQNIRGEASRWLLEAAEAFDRLEEFENSLKVYETLAAADPSDPDRQLKLAAARIAAGGRSDLAAEQLAVFAEHRSEGPASELGVEFYRAAVELCPQVPSLLAGLAAGLRNGSLPSDALEFLDGLPSETQQDSLIRGERILCLLAQERNQEALEALLEENAACPAESVWVEVVRALLEVEGNTQLWEKLDEVLTRWGRSGIEERSMSLLRCLADLKEPGYIPALKRLGNALGEAQESAEWKRVQSRLVRAYEKDGRTEEAAEANSALGRADNATADAAPGVPAGDAEPNSLDKSTRTVEPAATDFSKTEVSQGGAASLDLKLPNSKSDRDFAQGRLAQAIAMEKYGLIDQALAQCMEVTRRFPGYREAWERTAHLLSLRGSIGPLRDALVSLALAQLVAGETDEAIETVKRARAKAPLELSVRARLQDLGLLDKKFVRHAPAVTEAKAPKKGTPSSPEPQPTVASKPAGKEVLIDFEFDTEDAEEQSESAPEPVSEEDDLSAIAAALESSIVDEVPDTPLVPEAEGEESLDDVFAAFKEQVAKEVDDDDHRTHYDLGIAYKEMGLLDESVREFEIASDDPALRCESCAMIAVLYRQQEDSARAVEWYQKALDSTESEDGVISNLRYEMAEMLVEVGETDQAMKIYRDLEILQPGFRDVQGLIEKLETRS